MEALFTPQNKAGRSRYLPLSAAAGPGACTCRQRGQHCSGWDPCPTPDPAAHRAGPPASRPPHHSRPRRPRGPEGRLSLRSQSFPNRRRSTGPEALAYLPRCGTPPLWPTLRDGSAGNKKSGSGCQVGRGERQAERTSWDQRGNVLTPRSPSGTQAWTTVRQG